MEERARMKKKERGTRFPFPQESRVLHREAAESTRPAGGRPLLPPRLVYRFPSNVQLLPYLLPTQLSPPPSSQYSLGQRLLRLRSQGERKAEDGCSLLCLS